jgi:hypothetical protein
LDGVVGAVLILVIQLRSPIARWIRTDVTAGADLYRSALSFVSGLWRDGSSRRGIGIRIVLGSCEGGVSNDRMNVT